MLVLVQKERQFCNSWNIPNNFKCFPFFIFQNNFSLFVWNTEKVQFPGIFEVLTKTTTSYECKTKLKKSGVFEWLGLFQRFQNSLRFFFLLKRMETFIRLNL